MRVAIIYNDKDVYVEFKPEKFREILNKYFNEYKNIDKALDKIIFDLKEETRTI